MKKIEAIIRADKFDDVKNGLVKIGVRGITAYDVRGRGEQIGAVFSGDDGFSFSEGELIPKKKIEIICIEEELQKILSSITSNAFTGKKGDGKIFVSDIQQIIKIRTEEQAKHN